MASTSLGVLKITSKDIKKYPGLAQIEEHDSQAAFGYAATSSGEALNFGMVGYEYLVIVESERHYFEERADALAFLNAVLLFR